MFDISYVTHSTLNPPKPILPNASCRNQRRPFTSADGAPELAPPNGAELAPNGAPRNPSTRTARVTSKLLGPSSPELKRRRSDAGPPLKRVGGRG